MGGKICFPCLAFHCFTLFFNGSRVSRAEQVSWDCSRVGKLTCRGCAGGAGDHHLCGRNANDHQSRPLAFISAAAFIGSGIISGGPGLKVTLLIVPVKRNGGW